MKILTATYFKNFFGFIAIFIGAALMFSLPTELNESREFDLLKGYSVASFIAVLLLGHIIGAKFVDDEKLDMKAKEL